MEKKESFFKRHRLAIMGTSLMVSIVALGVSTYAWFATAFMDSVLISSGDLTVTQAKFTYYRWAFTKTNGYIIPSTLLSGDGSFVTGTKTYNTAGSPDNQGDSSSYIMNTFDPYLSSVYASYSLDQRTALYMKLDITVETSCDFDFVLKSVLDSSFTLPDSKSDRLSKYVVLRILPASAIDETSFNLGTNDQTIYTTFKNAFKTNYTGTSFVFTDGVESLTLDSETSLMGADVPSRSTKTLSYWLMADYDQDKLSSAFGGVDFYAHDITLYQDFYYTISGTQNGI
jgi:hypothetical protein